MDTSDHHNEPTKMSARTEPQADLQSRADALDQLTTAVVVLDEALHVRYLNPAAEALFGTSRQHRVGAHVRELTSEGIDGLSPLLGPLGVVDLHRSPEDLPGVGSLRLFAGYAGWSAGQLDAELLAGGWFVVDAFPEDAVVEEPTELWRMVLGRQPGLLGHLDGYPDNPSMN